MEAILRALAQDLKARGGLNLKECFIDGTFVVAKKGVVCLAGQLSTTGSPLQTPSGELPRLRAVCLHYHLAATLFMR